MRVKGITLQQIILGLALLVALCWNLAQANEIKGLRLNADAGGTRAELLLQSDTAFRAFALDAPDRFVLDLPGVIPARGLQLPSPVGVVKAVRSGRPAPDTLRIVFDLSVPATQIKPRLEPGTDGPRLVLEWPGSVVQPLSKPLPGATPPAPDLPMQAVTASPTPALAPTPVVATAAATAANGVSKSTASANPAAILTASTHATSTAAISTAAISTGSIPTAAASNPVASKLPASNPAPATINPPPTQTLAVVAKPAVTGSPGTNAATTAVTRPALPAASSAVPAAAAAQAPEVATAEPVLPTASARSLQDLRAGSRPLIIAIDAGHGGQDPGAIGPTGKREKDVTLAIARELARQINATPGLKAVLTRDTDVFLPLTRRPQIARAAKADMFVSIHADAAENRAAKGSSVYVLSLRGASSQRARWLADKENAADLIGGGHVPKSDDMLTSVLLDLTQSGQMKASEHAAAHILEGLGSIGARHKTQIERANFAVLRTSDMPAMLVETAFISNPEEEKRLSDPTHQRKLARAVLDGVHAYFSRQPPPGTLYAARAKAQEVGPSLSVQAAPILITGGSP